MGDNNKKVDIFSEPKMMIFRQFLDASSLLFKRVCPSVGRSVHLSVTSYFSSMNFIKNIA